jgi:two-component system cell cycle response regulator
MENEAKTISEDSHVRAASPKATVTHQHMLNQVLEPKDDATSEQPATQSQSSSDQLNNDQQQEKRYSQAQFKILIVDDEPKNIKLLSAMLARENFLILTASNGLQAIEMVERELPDVVLLDVMMPLMNGFDVTKVLKNSPLTRSIPIILITALDSPESQALGFEAGAEELLKKPVNAAELIARIKTMLRLKQYQEQLTVRKKSEQHFSIGKEEDEVNKAPERSNQILLVEDNPNDVKLIKAYLSDQDIGLLVTDNGEKAIEIAQRNKIDLIILDVMLPGMNGFEVCRRLKAIEKIQDIPIVFTTSLSDSESKINGTELESDGYIVKPYDKRELIATIQLLLKKKKHLEELRCNYENTINLAINDGLTGLHNHAYFKRALDLEFKRALRQQYNLALMMIDIDNFKKFNDTLGHLAGDMLLREFGHLIKKNIREIDIAARYGGEEFIIILPYVDIEDTLIIARRIQTALASFTLPIEIPEAFGKVTVSIGLALCPLNANSPEQLIKKADEMLYKAKRTGKNKICF